MDLQKTELPAPFDHKGTFAIIPTDIGDTIPYVKIVLCAQTVGHVPLPWWLEMCRHFVKEAERE